MRLGNYVDLSEGDISCVVRTARPLNPEQIKLLAPLAEQVHESAGLIANAISHAEETPQTDTDDG
jgi:hypothetical protein